MVKKSMIECEKKCKKLVEKYVEKCREFKE